MENLGTYVRYACLTFIFIVYFKSLIIGSEFSFHYWIKYRKQYTNWYFSRETFTQFLDKEKVK